MAMAVVMTWMVESIDPPASWVEAECPTPNGLEMSRPAGEGMAAWAEASFTGSVPSGQDQLQGKDTPAGRPESIRGSWQRDPAGQVGSIEWLDAPDPCLGERDPPLAGDVRRKGSGARSAPPWRATHFNVRGQSHSVLDGPSRAYNGLEMSRPASQA